MELNEKVQIVKNAILNNPVLKDFKEYEHNIKYYKVIKENIDYLYIFWKNKSENEREKINNIYLEIKQVANQKYYDWELDFNSVIDFFDEELFDKIWDKILIKIYNIFKNTNAFDTVWMTKVTILKWFIWSKKWRIDSWNNLNDYFTYITWIVEDRKINNYPYWVQNIAKEVLGLYNLAFYDNYIYNNIVLIFLWFLFDVSINESNELQFYVKYKELFKSEIETLFSIIDLSKYDIKLSNNEEYNFKLNLIADRLIYELNKNYSDLLINKKNIDITRPKYWLIAPWEKAYKWDEFYENWIIWIWWDDLNDLSLYKNRNEINEKLKLLTRKVNPSNDSLACYEFTNVINKGDIIIPKEWSKYYLWYWIVESDYIFDETRNDYKSIRKVKWIKKWKWDEINGTVVLKTLTDITKYPEYVEKLKKLLWIEIDKITPINISNMIQNASKLLDTKKQIILYWPPWTGKTYNVNSVILQHLWEKYENQEELNKKINNLKKEWRVEFITFHQSFSYEEFIEWIKPEFDWDNENISYEIKDGIFKYISDNALDNYLKSELDEFSHNLDFDFVFELFNEYLKGNYFDKWKEYPLEAKVTIKWINENKWSYYLWWSVTSSQRLAIDVIKRDLLNFLNWKIVTYQDIKPTNESKREFHWNARYYFMIYWKFKDFIIRNKINYDKSKQKQELKNFYLVIDEINRWNISKIFGELITLLEADKRNIFSAKLPYSKKEFTIPSNLYIVATMNTSDKSIVSLDTALRRRFWFVEMLPDYDLELLQKEIEWIKLSDLLKKLNQRIEYLLDKDHLIWHSYFLKIESIEDLKTVFYNEIIPLLEEYFYWEEEKIKLVIWDAFFEENKIDYKKLFGKTDEDFDNWKNILKLKNIDSLWIDAFKKIINQVNNTKWDTENQ